MFAAKDTLFTTPSGYTISRSVRFRSSATAYFNRTFAAAGNQQKFTYSFWTKRGTLGGVYIASSGWSGSGATQGAAEFAFSGDAIQVDQQSNNAYDWRVVTTPVYRDPSAWYHIVLAVDTTQATAANRVIVYVNGVQVTSYSTASYPTQNSNTKFNATNQRIGSTDNGGSPYVTYDGYMTEFNFIDGQALTPSSFGSTNAITGVWQPKKYGGTYGTNGFYLNFSDNSAATAAAIGKDYSGNGNNWTPNNISVTAGVTYDSMIDVPTPYADGGTGRGNYCMLNAVNKGTTQTLTNGNLTLTASGHGTVLATIGATSSKWYGEATLTVAGVGGIGATINQTAESSYTQVAGKWWGYDNTAGFNLINGTTAVGYALRFASGQVWQWAIDVDNGKIWIGVNNAWLDSTNGTTGNPATGANPTFTFTAGTLIWPFLEDGGGSTWNANFGQRSFTYTPPSGFIALNTYNLPSSTITNGATYMNVLTWSGTGGSAGATRALTGLNFKPDFVWEKNRTSTQDHHLFDSVRGAGTNKTLASSSTGAEGGFNDTLYGYLSSFDSGGVTTTNGSSTWDNWNKSGDTFVAWCWNAGSGSSSSNTSGTITSTVSVNATAGFSVVTYTGTGANATVGHGLGVAPKMIIVKERNAVSQWIIAVDYGAFTWSSDYFQFDSGPKYTNAAGTMFRQAPTSSVFSVGTNSNVNGNTNTLVAYCWSAVAGFSAFGSYTGNGSSDGPFIYTGFRPRFVMIKSASNVGGATNWTMIDTSRSTYNVTAANLYANASSLEDASTYLDINSNGFKVRNSFRDVNDNGGTMIYAAFAENPFKNALAR